jgi:manganese oxidase
VQSRPPARRAAAPSCTHSHFDEDRQVGLGLSAPFVIEPPSKPAFDIERTIFLGEWNLDPATGATGPPMQVEGSFPNYFTIDGKAFPATRRSR